jgi:hypothetical protein
MFSVMTEKHVGHSQQQKNKHNTKTLKNSKTELSSSISLKQDPTQNSPSQLVT